MLQRNSEHYIKCGPSFNKANVGYWRLLLNEPDDLWPKLGATAAITLLIVGQLTASIVIDHFGVFETPVRHLDWNRAFAVVLLVSGAVLVVR